MAELLHIPGERDHTFMDDEGEVVFVDNIQDPEVSVAAGREEYWRGISAASSVGAMAVRSGVSVSSEVSHFDDEEARELAMTYGEELFEERLAARLREAEKTGDQAKISRARALNRAEREDRIRKRNPRTRYLGNNGPYVE